MFPPEHHLDGLIDPLAVSFYAATEYRECPSLPRMLDQYRALLQKYPFSVEAVGEREWRITGRKVQDNSTISVSNTIDVVSGFTPVRRECVYSVRGKHGNRDAVIWRGETRWEQQAGVWLPVGDTLHEFHHDGKPMYDIHVEIAWRDLNVPIPETEFEWEALDVPEDVGVYDFTKGSGMTGITVREDRRPAPVPPRRWVGWVLTGAGVAAALGALAWFVVRSRMRRVRKSSSGVTP